MIAKGASRSGARQLAVYLMRVENYATGEPADLLEMQSPWADAPNGTPERAAAKLIETFRDWQTLVEGTKQGRDGLYHAQISPEAHYARMMTPEQWKRAADILGEELGLKDQPRAIVLHSAGEDRPHLHVVWQRTDIDSMKVISDGYNYVAHERASQRMELEFGHEFVPGKHAKRDREKQPEFPRADLTPDEAQREKRGGVNVADRKAEIMALYKAADSGAALKAALEDAGYLLANGDRGYVVVDKTGGQSVLTRNTGLKKKELEAFMAGVPLESLPTVDDAKSLQKARRADAPQPAVDQPQPAVDVSAEARRAKEETPTPLVEPLRPGVEASKFVMPPESPQPPAPRDEKLEALEKAIADRQAEELKKYRELHAHQLRQKQFELDKELHDKLARFEGIQNEQRQAQAERLADAGKGMAAFLHALKLRLNPTLAAEEAKQRRDQTAQLEKRLEQERKDYIKLLDQTRQQDFDNTKERQAQQLRDVGTKGAEERDRYIREYKEAERLREQMQREERERRRDGPEPPTRVR